MRIESIAIRGVLRFSAELQLDLRSIPPGSLVAIIGDNGEGKTTIAETMAPAPIFRAFPSRSDKPLHDYASGRDSYLETQFAIEGRGIFRARVNLDGVRRESDAILEQTLPDGSRVLLNDGKLKTFDDAVARFFPSPEAFHASAFAAQSRDGSLTSKKRQGRRQILASLLGLERYESMSATAKAAADLIDRDRAKLVAQRELLAAQTSGSPPIQTSREPDGDGDRVFPADRR